MKSLNLYISERLVVNKDYKDLYTCEPKTFEELRKIIEDRYNELGPGTKDMPIDFNDIDVSNIDSFCDKNTNNGIFQQTKFKYIDISDWNVSNVESMFHMFYCCNELKSVGDLSNWDVSDVEDMTSMFENCKQLKSVGDLSNWNVSKVTCMNSMFYSCKKLISIGDLSNWNVSNVKDMNNTFKESGITNIPKWYKE